jgi:hypothetical protein
MYTRVRTFRISTLETTLPAGGQVSRRTSQPGASYAFDDGTGHSRGNNYKSGWRRGGGHQLKSINSSNHTHNHEGEKL